MNINSTHIAFLQKNDFFLTWFCLPFCCERGVKCCLTERCSIVMLHPHIQFAILSSFFCTTQVAFTKGPQPLVGCYSIFKHHSARSQPPHRPALGTCNKLSSSENTKSELDQSWTEPLYRFTPHKHFHFLCDLTPKHSNGQCVCLGLLAL